MTADFAYGGDQLMSTKIHGGYDGYTPEGSPRVDWDVTTSYAYDANGRLTKEDLAVTSMSKTFAAKPIGALRDEVAKFYLSMRPKRPVENISRVGDLCGTNGSLLIGNPIDLRPFYAVSPNTSMIIPFGVNKATVTFTYPESYKPK